MNDWEIVHLDANDKEHKMYVTADDVYISKNRHGFIAEGIAVEIDYQIVSIERYVA